MCRRIGISGTSIEYCRIFCLRRRIWDRKTVIGLSSIPPPLPEETKLIYPRLGNTWECVVKAKISFLTGWPGKQKTFWFIVNEREDDYISEIRFYIAIPLDRPPPLLI